MVTRYQIPFGACYVSSYTAPELVHIARPFPLFFPICSHQGISDAESVWDSPVNHVYTVRDVLDIFLYHFQRKALFVPDSQWNVYRIARYRVAERPNWYEKLYDTKAVRCHVTGTVEDSGV